MNSCPWKRTGWRKARRFPARRPACPRHRPDGTGSGSWAPAAAGASSRAPRCRPSASLAGRSSRRRHASRRRSPRGCSRYSSRPGRRRWRARERYSPISPGLSLLCLNSTHSVSAGSSATRAPGSRGSRPSLEASSHGLRNGVFKLSVRGIFVQVAWRFLLENPGFSG